MSNCCYSRGPACMSVCLLQPRPPGSQLLLCNRYSHSLCCRYSLGLLAHSPSFAHPMQSLQPHAACATTAACQCVPSTAYQCVPTAHSMQSLQPRTACALPLQPASAPPLRGKCIRANCPTALTAFPARHANNQPPSTLTASTARIPTTNHPNRFLIPPHQPP